MRIAAISLGVYALYLPVAVLVGSTHVPAARPVGAVVETLLRLDRDDPDQYLARSYVFLPSKYPSTDGIDVYENLTRLPHESLTFTVDSGAYVVRFRTSDGSDPRSNGRRYWLVSRVSH